ncbi:MAG: hypothetical protein BWY80_01369 [Firmicutes bacterium ADurb.Bin456]|nr:MAG: hypothetical protein BWY80_01369 [Firmicutes bacterium ADurb.Bin456]
MGNGNYFFLGFKQENRHTIRIIAGQGHPGNPCYKGIRTGQGTLAGEGAPSPVLKTNYFDPVSVNLASGNQIRRINSQGLTSKFTVSPDICLIVPDVKGGVQGFKRCSADTIKAGCKTVNHLSRRLEMGKYIKLQAAFYSKRMHNTKTLSQNP